MVTWNDPVILSVRREYKKTDKGLFWFTVVDLDCHFEAGDRLAMSADRHLVCAGNSVWSSSLGLGDNQYADYHTNAISDDSKIQVSSRLSTFGQRNLLDYEIKLNGNSAASGYLDTAQYTGQGQFISVASAGVYRDINGNGVCYHPAEVIGWFQNPPTPHSIRHNTANSFGLVVSTVTNSAITINIDNTTLAAGFAYLDNSKSIVHPYEEGGYTDPEGDVDPPEPDEVPNQTPDDLPSQFSDLSAGLYRLYAMDDSELSAFSQQLWKPSVLSSLKNYLERPTDIVMGLRSYPFEVNAGAGVNIGFNWVNDWVSSGVVGHPISGNGIQQVIFGTLQVPRPSDLFYDYQPFSSAMLHLPYIGFVPMKMNEIVGKTLYIRYSVDLASGDFTAWVTMGASDETEPYYNLKVYGYYQGNISKPLPLTQQDMWQLYKKGAEIALNAAGAIGTLATGSLMKATGEYLADMPLTGKGAVLRYESGSEMASAGSAMMGDYKRKGTQAVNSALEMSYVSSPIERNGYLDGSTGRTSSQECFLIITYPDQCVPENQSILGYPTNINGPLSKVSGYTEVKEIRLASGIASEYELAELEGIVKGGIII